MSEQPDDDFTIKKLLPLFGLMLLGMILAAAIVIVVTEKAENKQQQKNETPNTVRYQ